MLNLSRMPIFSKAEVESVLRLSKILRTVSLKPSKPAPWIEGFVFCSVRTFQCPVYLMLETTYGSFEITIERAGIEILLDLILPGWRAEDIKVLPFEWCVAYVFDRYVNGTILADANINISLDNSSLSKTDIADPILYGTIQLGDSQCLVAIKLLSCDHVKIPIIPMLPRTGEHPLMPVSVIPSILGPRFNLNILRQLSCGDVVILARGTEVALPTRININGAIFWDGILSHDANFIAQYPQPRRQHMNMVDQTFNNNRHNDVSAKNIDTLVLPLDDLPMHLEVQFKRKTMTLAEISTLAAGVILDLGINLSEAVVLKINDEAMGTGHLVQIGDLVGVQINRWNVGPMQHPTQTALQHEQMEIELA